MHRFARLLLLALLVFTATLGAQVPAPVVKVPFEKLAYPVTTGEGPFGYVPVTADREVILMMLKNGSYRQLDQYFDALQRSVSQRIQYETEFGDAFLAFDNRDPSLRPLIEAWRDSLPSSTHARVALATWYQTQAWEARGTRYARDTPAQNMTRMGELAKDAAKEALAGLQMDSTHLVGWVTLIRIAQIAGTQGEARQIVDAARRIHPASYLIPVSYMARLEPRWGGSYEEMDAYAAEVMADRQLNPRLVTLRGAAREDQASLLISDEKYDQAIVLLNQALEDGPEPTYFLQRANAHYYRGDNLRALEDANQVLLFRHQNRRAQHIHAAVVLRAADSLKGNQRTSALRQARDEFVALKPWDDDPGHTQDHINFANYHLQNCAVDVTQCRGGGNRSVFPTTLSWQMKLLLGVLGLVALYNFFRWATGGFPVPRYIHFLAVLAAIVVAGALYMAQQQRGTLAPGAWRFVAIIPLGLYILAIGLGGATWASQRRKGQG